MEFDEVTRLLLVLGCHRSGTSVATKALECLGVSLGDKADWRGADNEAGFWEDQDILALDEAVLRRYGATWDSLALDTNIPPWAYSDITAAAKIALMTKLHRFPLLAIKDPRLCRLMPFWRPVFETLGCAVSVVHVARHPMAVARSLAARNGLSIAHGLALWKDHVERQFADVDPAWPSVAIDHNALVTSPAWRIARVAKALSLTMDEVAANRFAEEFVDFRLWHERAEDTELPVEIEAVWRGIWEMAA